MFVFFTNCRKQLVKVKSKRQPSIYLKHVIFFSFPFHFPFFLNKFQTFFSQLFFKNSKYTVTLKRSVALLAEQVFNLPGALNTKSFEMFPDSVIDTGISLIEKPDFHRLSDVIQMIVREQCKSLYEKNYIRHSLTSSRYNSLCLRLSIVRDQKLS